MHFINVALVNDSNGDKPIPDPLQTVRYFNRSLIGSPPDGDGAVRDWLLRLGLRVR